MNRAMENRYFKTAYLTYWQRVQKRFLIPLVLIVVFSFVVTVNRDRFASTLLAIPFYVLVLAPTLYTSRRIINEVEFINGQIGVTGFTFNTPWKSAIEIADAKIEIKPKGDEFYLRIKSDGNQFDINRSFHWDYASLAEIFREFKKRKEEKIILDEKLLLDGMEKQVREVNSKR